MALVYHPPLNHWKREHSWGGAKLLLPPMVMNVLAPSPTAHTFFLFFALVETWGFPRPFPWRCDWRTGRPCGEVAGSRPGSDGAAFCRRSPWFNGWGFNLPRGQSLLDKWNLIPEGIDILMTHGPPLGESPAAASSFGGGGGGVSHGLMEFRPCRFQRLGPQGAAAGGLRGAAQHGPEEGAAQAPRLRTHPRR